MSDGSIRYQRRGSLAPIIYWLSESDREWIKGLADGLYPTEIFAELEKLEGRPDQVWDGGAA